MKQAAGLFLSIGLTIAFATAVAAQSSAPKFEIGAHFTTLRIGRFDTADPGVGARVTYNLNDHFAVESEFNFFPRQKGTASIVENGGQKTQGLFGVKYGVRSERWGIFGKFRPGFVHFDKRLNLCPPNAGCIAAFTFRPRTEWAMDLGGALEYYPARSVMLRFDLGSTLIRFTDRGFPTSTEGNLQFSTGIGFRF